MDRLNELFVLPIGLEPVVNIDNKITLYGSKALNDKLTESLSKSRRGKMIYNNAKNMINIGLIIPCLVESGILSYLRKKIIKDSSGGFLRVLRIILTGKNPNEHPLDHILALYDFHDNRILVLIENHIKDKFSATASDLSIALSLTHEMMHMYAHQNPRKFLNLFKDELNSYYFNYFEEIFKLKNSKMVKNLIDEFYTNLFLKCEMTTLHSPYVITKYLTKLQPFSDLEKPKFLDIINDYITITKVLQKNDITKFTNLARTKLKYLIKPTYNSYLTSFGKIPSKGCGQELLFPSEVICGCVDIKMDSKIKFALQSLS